MRAARIDRGQFQRYALAITVTALGFLLTLIMNVVTERNVFQVSVAAVVISAWYGGLGPGLLSTALSALGMTYYLLEPLFSFHVLNGADVLQLAFFLLVAVLMSWLSEARLQAETKLHTRSEELEEANRELGSFSYTVSHDLRSPLRAIDGYTRILIDECSSQLSAAAHRYLQLVRASVKQMDKLVEDLLAFSRLGRQALRKRPLNPSDLAREAFEELKREHEGRIVEVLIDEIPLCEGDPTLLKQVFLNLLQNALKFTRARDRAIIEVGWTATEKGTAYFIKDNGIGFNMLHADQLFGVFQRLQRAEDYEGTGVGLAIVQRIIHRHGGTVWAESEVNRGATFYFTLSGDGHHA